MAKRPTQRGVTLVELLVTIVLASIFFAAMVPLFVFAQKQSSGDRARVIAANVAQSKLETVRSVDYTLLDEGGTYFTSVEGIADGFGSTWPNDMGGPVKVYSITYDVEFVHPSPDSTDVIYKMVTVDVSWTPPPKPVKHVVFRTAIYPQYKGPEIAEMTVGDLDAKGLLYKSPVHVAVRVDPVELPQPDHVHFAVSAANGSLISSADVTQHDAATGWFRWDWDVVEAGAGDGEYRFSAVAVSATNQPGEYQRQNYILDTGEPAAPTLEASGVQAGDGVVSIHWSPPSPVAGDLDYYVVERSGGTNTQIFSNLSKAATTYIDTSVTNDITYSYTVRAVDQYGKSSDPSEPPVSATPALQADGEAPSAPTGLTSTLVGQNVTLSWAKNPDADGVMLYRVYRDSNHTSPIAIITTVATQALYSYMDPAIGWSVNNTYEVTAVDAALNESSLATFQSVTTPAAPTERPFTLTVKVTGMNATVMVSSLITGQVYDTRGEPVTNDRSIQPIVVKANDKKGVTFEPLYYSVYRVVVTFTLPTGGIVKKTQDVELVRDETVEFLYP